MTEQEYCDLSDLQLLRVIKDITSSMNAFDEPNKKILSRINADIRLMIGNLEPKIDTYMSKEGED